MYVHNPREFTNLVLASEYSENIMSIYKNQLDFHTLAENKQKNFKTFTITSK